MCLCGWVGEWVSACVSVCVWGGAGVKDFSSGSLGFRVPGLGFRESSSWFLGEPALRAGAHIIIIIIYYYYYYYHYYIPPAALGECRTECAGAQIEP